MDLGLRATLAPKQVLNLMLQRSLEILRLPQLELSVLVSEEIEKNPLLELESDTTSSSSSPVQEPIAVVSLYEFLLSQIRDALPGEEKIGYDLLALLDERGFLPIPIEELSGLIHIPIARLESIVRVLKTFDPPGIFAQNVREAFLIQLEKMGEKKSLAFRLIDEVFEDFLRGSFGSIKKKLQISPSDLREAVQKLARLSSRPAEAFHTTPNPPLYPDLFMVQINDEWIAESSEDGLPKFRLKGEYLHLPALPALQKQTLRSFVVQAKWLIRSIQRRKNLLVSIGNYLIRKQTAFFEEGGKIIPIPALELAQKFEVHESTISRAISQKIIATPWGCMSLKRFISSNDEAKDLLQRFISQEDKESPLTDAQLSALLQRAGQPTARRTISKYRNQMKIKGALARKHSC